jgi:hypothetical protein
MRLIGLAYGEKAEQTWKQRALRLPSYSAATAFLILYIEFIRFAPCGSSWTIISAEPQLFLAFRDFLGLNMIGDR